jgi:Tol biopolymer transport system component
MMPAGDVQPLDTGSPWNASPAWMPDGRTLIFAVGTNQGAHLARIAVEPGASASRLRGAGHYGRHPSITRTPAGRVRLVYTHQFESVNIWLQPLGSAAPAAELITSAHWSYEPDYSQDGKRIAFLSDRSGQPEVWVAGGDGRNPQQWTFLGKPSLGAPRWSPDGRSIAFTVPGADGSSIYLVDGPDTAPRPVPGAHRCGYLAWAPHGRALYFSSNRTGGPQIWKIAPEGGEAVQLTTRGGRVPAISTDGRYLHYLRPMSTSSGEQQLFRIPLTGGEEEKVLDFVDAYSIAGPGIAFKYYRADHPGRGLQFFRFSSRSSEAMPKSAKPLRYGIALDPTGRHVLYSQADYQVSDLMLVDGLQ